jgi:Tol biopolymer transport system component
MAASSCLVPTGKKCSTCYRKFLRGTGQEEPLFESSSSNKYPMDWSSDGRFILYAQIEEKTGYDVWALPLFGERKPFPVLITLFDERYPQFSPDGRWVAYQSNGRARTISICSPFLDLGRDRGSRPMAARRCAGAATVENCSTWPRTASDGRGCDSGIASPDGQRFLMLVEAREAAVQPIRVITNWAGARR